MATLPFLTLPLVAQSGVQTQAVVTVMPKSGDETLNIPEAQVQATSMASAARSQVGPRYAANNRDCKSSY